MQGNHIAREAQQQAERQVRHGSIQHAWGVAHQHIARVYAINLHVVITNGIVGDDLQVWKGIK